MPMAISSSNDNQVPKFVDGANLIFENATHLFQEASILADANHWTRSVFLHQISIEECAKIQMIGEYVTAVMSGENVDMNKWLRSFRSHQHKNNTNAYMATPTEEEKIARRSSDSEMAIKVFKKFQKHFHQEVNGIKNSSLYVDFSNGNFTTPKDSVGEKEQVEFSALNHYFLGISKSSLLVLEQIKNSPSYLEKISLLIKERPDEVIQQLGSDSVDGLAAIVEAMLRSCYKN